MTVGAQVGTLLGVALNISRNQLLLWMSIGVVAWSVGLIALAVQHWFFNTLWRSYRATLWEHQISAPFLL